MVCRYILHGRADSFEMMYYKRNDEKYTGSLELTLKEPWEPGKTRSNSLWHYSIEPSIGKKLG